jgi:hypothetical protein
MKRLDIPGREPNEVDAGNQSIVTSEAVSEKVNLG